MSGQKTYEEYLGELEKLVSEIEDPSKPLSEVSKDVKKAMGLIEICRKMLREKGEEVNKLINGE